MYCGSRICAAVPMNCAEVDGRLLRSMLATCPSRNSTFVMPVSNGFFASNFPCRPPDTRLALLNGFQATPSYMNATSALRRIALICLRGGPGAVGSYEIDVEGTERIAADALSRARYVAPLMPYA